MKKYNVWLVVVVVFSMSMVLGIGCKGEAAPVTLNIIIEQVPDYDIVVELTKNFEAANPVDMILNGFCCFSRSASGDSVNIFIHFKCIQHTYHNRS